MSAIAETTSLGFYLKFATTTSRELRERFSASANWNDFPQVIPPCNPFDHSFSVFVFVFRKKQIAVLPVYRYANQARCDSCTPSGL